MTTTAPRAGPCRSCNLQTWNHGQFARYLATVVKYARDHWNVDDRYVEPFYEPTPGVWLLDIPEHGFANQEGSISRIRSRLR